MYTAGTSGQAVTATHDSFLMYSEISEDARSWMIAISQVINEVRMSNMSCHMYIHTCVHKYMCNSACVCTYVRVYISICVIVHVYVHTYVCT